MPALVGKLSTQMKTIEGDLEKLKKRLVYLETTDKNSRQHIEKMLQQGQGGSGA